MKAKGTDLKRLEELYNAAGNGMAVVYGKKDGGLRQLLKEFVSDKKFFYYYCRQVSAEEQCRMMGMEIEKKYDVRLQNHTYQEYFKRIKSGDASKLVVIIDEAQYLLKKDPSFFAGLLDPRFSGCLHSHSNCSPGFQPVLPQRIAFTCSSSGIERSAPFFVVTR